VMGVTNDERMGDRVQVILVITGLGAPTLEEAVSNLKSAVSEPGLKAENISQAAPVSREPVKEEHRVLPSFEAQARPPEVLFASPSGQNLDLPAFLRRRTQPSGIAGAD
jgi:hypothetical protein